MPRYVPAGGMRGFALTGALRVLSVKENCRRTWHCTKSRTLSTSSSALIFFREVIVSSIWYAVAVSCGLQSVRTHIAEGNKMTKRTMQFVIQMILL